MNRFIKLVLFFSIAANAVLLAGLATGWFLFGKSPGDSARADGRGGKNAFVAALSPEVAKEVAALLSAGDAAALRDKLRELSLPDDIVRDVVRGCVASRFTARKREIGRAAREAALNQPYWRRKPGHAAGYISAFYTPEQQKELREISREEDRQIRQILGADEKADYALAQYAFLPREKAARLRGMENDYNDMQAQIRQEMSGFRMPGDEARLKLLGEEKQRDTLAMLSPEEREAYEFRQSETARKLQSTLAGFDASEGEYKAIFALQRELDEKFPADARISASLYGGADMSEAYKALREGQKEVDAQIKALLGDERYAEYLRGQRQDYQSLLGAAQRFNLSAETVAQTYQAREDAASEARRISDDRTLGAEQKAEAYAALASQATAQIRAALGDEIGDAYIDNALGWLKKLPSGGRVTVTPRGEVSVSQPKSRKSK